MHNRNNLILIAAALAAFTTPPLAGAAGLQGIPQDVNAKMYRLMARQNRQSTTSSTSSTGTGCAGCTDVSADGGNLTVGRINGGKLRGSVEMNILVDGDIVNISRGR